MPTRNDEFVPPEVLEAEVRRACRARWPSSEIGGAVLIDGRERDGVYITDDVVHLVETTANTRIEKVVGDVEKLRELKKKFKKTHPDHAIKSWFITLHDPTADQRRVALELDGTVIIESLDDFRSRLINAPHYLACRKKHAFGSVRNPKTDSSSFEGKLIQMPLLSSTNETASIDDLLDDIRAGGTVLLTGDYGCGKSMHMREVFQLLRRSFLKRRTLRFPIYLNLNEHQGQTVPAEALWRHAQLIGFERPSQLVQAWKNGYTYILLDGFDEMAALGFGAGASRLRDIRYRAVELVRRFILDSPETCGMFISGRSYYFDDANELTESIFGRREYSWYSIGEFTEEALKEYLRSLGWSRNVPAWFPTRPLLVGYLALRGGLDDAKVDFGPAEGWDYLLGRISAREAQQIAAGLDGATLRSIIEGLADFARGFEGGLGPIERADYEKVYKHVVGTSPDEHAMAHLQRLPGFGVSDTHKFARQFIDQDLASVAKSGSISRFINDPYNFESFASLETWESALPSLAHQVVAFRSTDIPPKKFIVAARYACDRLGAGALALDVLSSGIESLGALEESPPLSISSIVIPELKISNSADFRNISFYTCIIRTLELDIDGAITLQQVPTFHECLIQKIFGATSSSSLPAGMFDDGTDVVSFEDQASTTAEILQLDKPLPVRVGMTIVKKLFLQPGTGRRESSLFRGLSNRAQGYVEGVIRILRAEGVASEVVSRGERRWTPNRRQTRLAHEIVHGSVETEEALRLIEKFERLS